MIERLIDEKAANEAERRLRELIDGHGEWLCAGGDAGAAVSLKKSECDFSVSHGRLIFTYWGNSGALAWRVTAWEWTGQKLLLTASRRMGAERVRLELIPRATVAALAAHVADTRRHASLRLAQLACATLGGSIVERAGLSTGPRRGEPGRYARILLRRAGHESVAVTCDIAEAGARGVDAFLSSALLWFTRAQERRTRPPYLTRLWLVAGQGSIATIAERLALLREDLRRVMALYRLDDEWRELAPVRAPALEELVSETPQRFRRPSPDVLSETAARITAHAPEAIDVMRSRHAETLRFRGLVFARVRRVMDSERVWFGVDGARRRLLDEDTPEEWTKLLRDLTEHRRADAPDRRHALYRASPEAWLESMLRRDITRLDPGLRLAPLFAQFRPSRGAGAHTRPIDLLALRRDGRLVVIELKVSEDREHVLQAADYWRRVETHRRAGHITRARLFGDAEISDDPPLIYLVAPALRFHRAFNTLARSITPSIRMYRFDLNEDWRAGVRVTRRVTLTSNWQ
ncbi:MAG TPA: hypothetical protein VN256_19495 [Pyrinomonadaceae bacterium]|nr:hypothetical protein [Pyrinomonadaceae bacterium]